jgi:16S rRNA (adenine1518-N6/adenine1519-N6)-dimethyltransferase
VPALTPATIPALLDRHGVAPSRALGQHFLADPNTARRIVRLADVGAGDRVLEVGPGIGSLTSALLEAGAHVTAVELDRHIIPALREVVGDAVRVVQGDALSVDLAAVLGDAATAPHTLVANLPYNIATPIVMRFLETAPQIRTMLVMVQREVGERLAAGPGSKTYGAPSVKVAYHARARVAGLVPPGVFVPPPRVESALVHLARHAEPPVVVPSVDRMFALVRAGFAQRRKMLRRALRTELGESTDAVLSTAGIDGRRRAETLDLAAWAAIGRAAG